MPNLPWSDENVKTNLLVIARLRIDDKLSVLKAGANPGVAEFQNLGKGHRGLRAVFSIQKGGFFSKTHQRKERRKKGEDILEDRQYFIPLVQIFTNARTLWLAGAGEIELAHIKNAYAGLLNLQKTYLDENDEQRFQKMMRINQAISQLIPQEHEKHNCIIVKEGAQVLNLFQYKKVLPNLEDTLKGFLDLSSNSMAGSEQGVGTAWGTQLIVTAEVINSVISVVPTMFRLTGPTTLPTLNAPYTRHGLGVCKQFPTDWHRKPPIVDGTAMARNWGALKKLFIKLGGDEGMLMLVSQLTCQAGLESIPQSLLTYRSQGAQNRMAPDWVLFYNGKFYAPASVERNLYIDTQTRIVEMKLVMKFPVLFSTRRKEDQGSPMRCEIVAGGEMSITMTLIVTLQRKGNRINLNLTKAELDITGL
ncbi:MAG: hypothetical protein JW821_15445 [Deltaproteobacteria bacterium]|nr:hypothetical protein [Deltaproteobacteria bacterium]